MISGAHIERSVLGPWATVESGAKVVDSVVFDRVRIGRGRHRAQRAILDKEVVVDAGATVGVDHDADRARGFTVTDSGITVVGKGVRVTDDVPPAARRQMAPLRWPASSSSSMSTPP